MELNREHFRAIIFHNFRRGLSRQECFDELNSLYSDKAPSYSTVKNRYNEFNRGRCSIQDESRAGRPKSVVVPEKINAVRELIKQDRHVTYREIEASLDISMTSINKILHEHLSVKKICSRWIPHNLTNAQKKARVDWCKEMLEKYIQGTSKAVYNIYTGDESWIYAYELETKQQSTVWVFQDEAKPTKVVRGRSTSKQMIACFFGINGHVATVALEQRRMVNSEWYMTICLPEVIGEIRKKQKNRRIILHRDNASSHTSTQTKAFLTERKIELMGHPPIIGKMKRMANPINVSNKRTCFNDETKLDSSFSDEAVPLHHFHLGQDIYAAVTYFAIAVQIHLRQYGRDDNNRLFPTKRGMPAFSLTRMEGLIENRHSFLTKGLSVGLQTYFLRRMDESTLQ
ncbi:putative mariner transposase [Nephila pilipes]|uniref:Putative mariner transposase n=1 Tax=Nephila pilipes TaxID=299642 RepID=A0A8X6UQW4_NEPPI|nr:putative mariner transposase [Nephila pilipes]